MLTGCKRAIESRRERESDRTGLLWAHAARGINVSAAAQVRRQSDETWGDTVSQADGSLGTAECTPRRGLPAGSRAAIVRL